MTLALRFHNFIERNNCLRPVTAQTTDYLQANPRLYKLALLVNHLFRAIAMAALMCCLPFSAPITILLCFASSLFYRLTVENNCAYKFALPSLGGAIALLAAKRALIHRAALASLAAAATTCALLLPFVAYAAYITLTVSHDVDVRCGV